jgi:WD40 repeat protein
MGKDILLTGAIFLLPALVAVYWEPSPLRLKTILKSGVPHRLCCFSPDGTILVTTPATEIGSNSYCLCLWDTVTGKQRLSVGETSIPYAKVRLSKDARFLAAVGAGSGKYRRLYVSSCYDLGDVEQYQDAEAYQRVNIWEASSALEWSDSKDDDVWGKYRNFHFSPDGKFLLCHWNSYSYLSSSRQHDDRLDVWELATKKVQARIAGKPLAIAFAPDEKHFALFAWNPSLERREVQVWKLTGGSGGVTCISRHKIATDLVAFSAQCDTFASVGYPKGGTHPAEVKLWDLHTGTLRASTTHFESHGHIHSIQFSPDGRYLIAESVVRYMKGSPDNKTAIWDTKEGLTLVGKWPTLATLSPDSKYLTVTDDTGADLLKLASLREQASLHAPADRRELFLYLDGGGPEPPNVIYSPNSKLVILTGLPRELDPPGLHDRFNEWINGPASSRTFYAVAHAWNVETGKHQAAFKCCTQALFSSDCRFLATDAEEDVILLWDVRQSSANFTALYGAASVWLLVLLGVGSFNLILWRRKAARSAI